MAQHDPAAGHALANIVVGIALEVEMQPARVPHAEALPGVADAAHRQRSIFHAVVAPAARDLTRDACADRAVVVVELILPFAAAASFDGRQHVTHHVLGELAPVEGYVAPGMAELRSIATESGIRQDRCEIELA